MDLPKPCIVKKGMATEWSNLLPERTIVASTLGEDDSEDVLVRELDYSILISF